MNAAILAGLTTLTVGAIAWCIRDYQEYLALGPGGLPHDIRGWAAVNILRPFALSKNGAKQTSTYPSEGAHEEIRSLPNRMGERASVGGIIPHRQLSQHSPEEMKQVWVSPRQTAGEAQCQLLSFLVHQKSTQECCYPE